MPSRRWRGDLPGRGYIRSPRHEVAAFIIADRVGLLSGRHFQLGLDRADCGEGIIPAPFRLAGHKSIIGIDRIVLTLHPPGLKSGLFQREFDVPPLCVVVERMCRNGLQRGFDAERLKQPDDFGANGLIDP